MTRTQKITVIALGYAAIVFIGTLIFGQDNFFYGQVLLNSLAWAGIGFTLGFIENYIGWGFFNKWVNKE